VFKNVFDGDAGIGFPSSIEANSELEDGDPDPWDTLSLNKSFDELVFRSLRGVFSLSFFGVRWPKVGEDVMYVLFPIATV